uniref:Uncharacterized protein n=1 Tax=Knipowitschia caucasica TaxID=637954 RepID=A0AAV2L9E0_KNICA
MRGGEGGVRVVRVVRVAEGHKGLRSCVPPLGLLPVNKSSFATTQEGRATGRTCNRLMLSLLLRTSVYS